MIRFTSAVRDALASRNWYAALYLSLTIPDICARLESGDGKTNGSRYASWFDRHMAHHYRHSLGLSQDPYIFLSGNDCYALRCALLHEGGADITTQKKREALDKFHFTIGTAHCNQFNAILQLDVRTFCEQVCSGTEQWAIEFSTNHPDKQQRLSELVTIFEGPHEMGGGVFFG